MRWTERGMRGVIAALVFVAPACGGHVPPPLTPRPVVDARDTHVRRLQLEVARLLEAPALARAHVGAAIASLTRGDRLFALNADRLFMPASNQKLLTLAVAAERVGWGFSFETSLHPLGPVRDGVLRGDLVVVGSGDPSIGTRHDAPTAGTFDRWAAELKRAGIQRVSGRLIGDDRAFEDEAHGAGWAWDILPYGYAAPIGALQVNESSLRLLVAPGTAVGAPAAVTIEDSGGDVLVVPQVLTGEAGSTAWFTTTRRGGRDRLSFEGAIPAGSAVLRRTVAVANPTLYFLRALERSLVGNGITIDGGVADVDDVLGGLVDPLPPPVLVHRSAPLRELAPVLMKESQNLYAETLLRTLGRLTGTGATQTAGRDAVRETLIAWGVPSEAYVLSDASGLSRYNYVTPDTLLAILRHMHRDSRHQAAWLASLPVGGVDGTLERRFRGSPAEGRVRAKTGTVSNVRALSGYVDAANGELIAFVLVINNATVPAREIDLVTDAIVERLATFER